MYISTLYVYVLYIKSFTKTSAVSKPRTACYRYFENKNDVKFMYVVCMKLRLKCKIKLKKENVLILPYTCKLIVL